MTKFPCATAKILTIFLFAFALLLGLGSNTTSQAQCAEPAFSGPSTFAGDRGSNSVAVGEFNGDGKLDLAVPNQNANNVSILLGDGTGGFGPPSSFSVAAEPRVIATGDFNKDGKTDLAVGHHINGSISVLLGNGSGSFSAPSAIGSNILASGLAVADFNNDGNPDIASSTFGFQVILLGNGSGGFSVNNISLGSVASSVAAGDLNGDGFSDAAFAATDAGNWKIALVLGNAAGTFSVNSTFPVSQQPQGIAIGNFNADTQPDLVVTGDWAESKVFLFTNQGGGNFGPSVNLFAGRTPRGVTVGDFNSDGKLDAAVADVEANHVMIAFGNGLGSFSGSAFYGAGVAPSTVAVGDFNTDGKLDLITPNVGNTTPPNTPVGGVAVLLGKGTGAFESYRSYVYPPTGGFSLMPTSEAVGDFNNNGRPDLAILFFAAPYVGVMLDDGFGELIQPTGFYDAGNRPVSIAIADLNGDNNADFVTANNFGNNVSIFFGHGNGTFMPRFQIPVNANPVFVGVGDFNGDTKRDLIVTHESSANALVLLGDGIGNFAPTGGAPQPALKEIAIADFNHDGKSDVVAGNSPQNNVSIFLGDSTGHLSLSSTTPTPGINTAMRLQSGDLNGDTHPDLVTINTDRSTLTVFLGNGSGGLAPGVNFTTGPSPWDLSLADFNGDNKVDVAVANSGASYVSLFPGDGLGGLSTSAVSLAGVNPNGLAKADFDQDTKTDLAVLSGTGSAVSILKNILASLPCLSVNDVTVTETDSGTVNAIFSVTLSAPSSQTVRVNYSLANETATKGTDFTAVADRLVFAPGETTKTISVPVLADLNDEIDETFKFQLASASGAAISDNEGLGTILDNDPLPSISINDSTANEAIQLRSFTVSLSVPSGKAITVQFATANGSATAGTQDAGNDYIATSGTLTIPAGQTSGQINVSGFGDSTFEPDETFFVNLSNPTDATISDSQGQATIINDDPVPSLILLDVGIAEGSTGSTQAVFIVRLSNPTSQNVTLDFATTSDTATSGSDFVANSGTLTFAPGEAEKSVVVLITGDVVDETIERFFLDVSNIQNVTSSTTRAQGTIFDDDGPTISINDISIVEGNSGTRAATFTLTLSAPSVQAIAVRVTSAPGTATTDSDFGSFNQSLTIPSGTGSRTFNALIVGDTNQEVDETFFLNLSNPINGTIGDSQGIVTILNDDSVIEFGTSTVSVGEGAKVLNVPVSRSGGGTSATVSVAYATSDLSGAIKCDVVNGKASSRCDYITTLGVLNFAAGETSKTISILLIDDAFAEGDETFSVTLTNPSGAVLGSTGIATLTINDNEVVNGSVNPIEDASFFVRQHYLDFLNREPDSGGLNFWTNEITSCGSDVQCIEVKRINVSAAFFLSIEFQETGYLVYRTYKSAFDDLPGAPVPVNFSDFLRDSQKIAQGVQVGAGNWEAQLQANKEAFALAFVQRSDFLTAFPNQLTASQFVDQLNANAGGVLSSSERASLIAMLTTPADLGQRGAVLLAIADDSDLKSNEANEAFVLMQYFGYLRRDPNDVPDSDFSGYNFWLTKLNQFNGNFVNAEMVKAFILSGEYRQRFGP